MRRSQTRWLRTERWWFVAPAVGGRVSMDPFSLPLGAVIAVRAQKVGWKPSNLVVFYSVQVRVGALTASYL